METTLLWQGKYCDGFLKIFQTEPGTVDYAFIGQEFTFSRQLEIVSHGFNGDAIVRAVFAEVKVDWECRTIREWELVKGSPDYVVH